jgi:NAD(P)-dependent dehydrogenase (short-subunit alcohol dehydrogenase family)
VTTARFAGKVAIVTGAGSGIGQAIAVRLASEGAAVVVAELDTETGTAVAEMIGGTFVCTDVREQVAVDAAVAFAVQRHGGLDVLVNNAGVTRLIQFFDITAGDWDYINAVNAKGAFLFLQAAARAMASGDRESGVIVNIASIAAKGYPGTSNAAYAASKGAVVSLTRIAALELARYGIRVNAVCPGITRTNMLAGLEEGGALVDSMRGAVPLRRLNEPADVASLVAFLASDEAATVTGQSWNVDGGLILD